MADSGQRERIVAHVRSYGLIPESDRHSLADVIENAFVAHCAVEVCSAANEPGSHWCAHHQDFVAERVRAEGLLAEALEALRELVRLKDGPRDAAYEKAKPGAWEAARAVLSCAERDPE